MKIFQPFESEIPTHRGFKQFVDCLTWINEEYKLYTCDEYDIHDYIEGVIFKRHNGNTFLVTIKELDVASDYFESYERSLVLEDDGSNETVNELEESIRTLRETVATQADSIRLLESQLKNTTTGTPLPFRIILGMADKDSGRWDRVVATFDDYKAAHLCYGHFVDTCDSTSEYDTVLFECYTDRKEYFTMLINNRATVSIGRY